MRHTHKYFQPFTMIQNMKDFVCAANKRFWTAPSWISDNFNTFQGLSLQHSLVGSKGTCTHTHAINPSPWFGEADNLFDFKWADKSMNICVLVHLAEVHELPVCCMFAVSCKMFNKAMYSHDTVSIVQLFRTWHSALRCFLGKLLIVV